MGKEYVLNLKSLKEQVYEYLRDQMQKGKLLPGSLINLDETSRKLGVSRTPLRDALLQLEMENFVAIIPRRGIVVKQLTIKDIQEYYEIIGSLESQAVLTAMHFIKTEDVKKMADLNIEMEAAISEDNFNRYYQKNLKFHDVFLSMCGNDNLIRIVANLKKRLYDFPRQEGFVKQWEVSSIEEHRKLVDLIAAGRKQEAATFIRDVHWSYKVQEIFIKEYYQHAAAFSRGNNAKFA
ncbi:MAG: GntR family transcriptional regulator [Candidatus Aminicenantes bacterium]|nr:GntR family transcriptional regulator [Candidatus Aminicenantes bacterium]